MVRHPENSLRGAEVCSEHYSISEQDSTEAAMQDAARRVLSHYCSVLGGVADGLNLKYYPCRPSGSIGGVIVSPVGEDNPRLSNTVNLAAVLNTELDHALDELSRARAEIAQLRAERAERQLAGQPVVREPQFRPCFPRVLGDGSRGSEPGRERCSSYGPTESLRTGWFGRGAPILPCCRSVPHAWGGSLGAPFRLGGLDGCGDGARC